jgi:hypothetical protein
MFNTLKPGGKVFIKTPNMENPFNLRSRYMDFSHEVGFTEHSLYEVLSTAGFRKSMYLELENLVEEESKQEL